MNIPQAAIDIIKEFEGLRLEAYRDSAGVFTIGYGTTAAANVGIDPRAGTIITQAQAEEYLRRAVEKFAATIQPMIKKPINDNEWSAFLSLAYNIGPGAFGKSSALRKFNAGDKAGAADAILLWNKADGKVLKGLHRRREAERALFLKPAVPVLPPNFEKSIAPLTDNHGGFWASFWFYVLLPIMALFGKKK